MQNKSLKTLFCLFSALLLVQKLAAEDVSFSITELYRSTWGGLHEYVFCDNDNNPDNGDEYMLSRLDWDITGIRSYGAAAEWRYRTDTDYTLSFIASLMGGIPAESGYMQDYDWQHTENNVYCGKLTNYSCHTNYLVSNYDFGIEAQWLTPSGLGADIGWDIRKLSFSGNDGYRQYDPSVVTHINLETEPKTPYKGTIITYDYVCNYLKTGVVYAKASRKGSEIRLGLWVVPMIAAVGKDHHVDRNLWFLDSMYGYLSGIQQAVSIKLAITDSVALFVKEESERFSVIKGSTYSWTGNKMPLRPSKESGSGGSSKETFSLSAGITLAY